MKNITNETLASEISPLEFLKNCPSDFFIDLEKNRVDPAKVRFETYSIFDNRGFHFNSFGAKYKDLFIPGGNDGNTPFNEGGELEHVEDFMRDYDFMGLLLFYEDVLIARAWMQEYDDRFILFDCHTIEGFGLNFELIADSFAESNGYKKSTEIEVLNNGISSGLLYIEGGGREILKNRESTSDSTTFDFGLDTAEYEKVYDIHEDYIYESETVYSDHLCEWIKKSDAMTAYDSEGREQIICGCGCVEYRICPCCDNPIINR